MQCFTSGSHKRFLEDENAWLKKMVEREQHLRHAAQQQLLEEHTKVALLENELVHAAHAAHELGESLCMYLSTGEKSNPSAASPWSIFSTKPFLPGASHSSDSGPDTTFPRGPDQSPPTPQLLASSAAAPPQKSPCYVTPGCNRSRNQPEWSKQDMGVLSERLKGLASEWHQRLEVCRSTTTSRATTPLVQGQAQEETRQPTSHHAQQQQQRFLAHQQRPQLPAPVAYGPLHEGVHNMQLAWRHAPALCNQKGGTANPMRTSDEESFDHYTSTGYSSDLSESQQQLQQQRGQAHQTTQVLVVKDTREQQPVCGWPQVDHSCEPMLHSSTDSDAHSSSGVDMQETAGMPELREQSCS